LEQRLKEQSEELILEKEKCLLALSTQKKEFENIKIKQEEEFEFKKIEMINQLQKE